MSHGDIDAGPNAQSDNYRCKARYESGLHEIQRRELMH